jgi:predicted MFS family arabinose efflux permease
LTTEAVILVFVCLGYGYSREIFSETAALFVAFACYILDQLLMSVGMARATYLQKIAVVPEDVAQTLTMGVTIDHALSITIALLGGILWVTWGYQYVFLLGACIAVANFFSALKVKTYRQQTSAR